MCRSFVEGGTVDPRLFEPLLYEHPDYLNCLIQSLRNRKLCHLLVLVLPIALDKQRFVVCKLTIQQNSKIMQVMEPSSPLASRFSWKSWWLVMKVPKDGYAETYSTRFKDHTYQLLQSYSQALLCVLSCCSLVLYMVMIYYYATCAVYCIIKLVHSWLAAYMYSMYTVYTCIL